MADIADAVEATDISSEMIAQAESHKCVRYVVAPAEQIPFPDKQFDLATVGLAFHWFEQTKFLAEAARVLKPDAWLVIYNHGFKGEMSESADFRHWAKELYPKRFPMPPRRSQSVSEGLVAPHRLKLMGTEEFANETEMTARQLTAYLLTQTNIISAVESGKMPVAEAAAWIEESVTPFFGGIRCTMKFGGSIWYLLRLADA